MKAVSVVVTIFVYATFGMILMLTLANLASVSGL
jgi:hypothetical protein